MDYQKIIEKHKVGTVAVKQALHYFHGLTITKIAAISGSHRRNAYAHIMAPKGTEVKAWDKRYESEKWNAIEAGEEIVNALPE